MIIYRRIYRPFTMQSRRTKFVRNSSAVGLGKSVGATGDADVEWFFVEFPKLTVVLAIFSSFSEPYIRLVHSLYY